MRRVFKTLIYRRPGVLSCRPQIPGPDPTVWTLHTSDLCESAKVNCLKALFCQNSYQAVSTKSLKKPGISGDCHTYQSGLNIHRFRLANFCASTQCRRSTTAVLTCTLRALVCVPIPNSILQMK